MRSDTFTQNAQRRKGRARPSGVFSTSAANPNLRKYVTPLVNGYPVRLQLDSGSDFTLVSHRTWEVMGRPVLLETSMEMVDASNHVMQLAGYFECQMSLNNRYGRGRCFVTTQGTLNLLGLDWIEKLQLWNMSSCGAALHGNLGLEHEPKNLKVDIHSLYPKVYNAELGHCTRFKASLNLRPDAQPIFKRNRPVPYATRTLVEQELDRLEQLGIITKVDYSNWAAPIVAVKKANGTVRLRPDFSTGLNDALEHHQYPLPLPDDIFATLNGGRYFSKIDLADAYLQVEVDEKSKELLTINTHRGLYRYNRLPFGVKSAPAIFQQIMDSMLSGIKGAVAYLDDVIVVGRTEEEHRNNLDAVFKRIGEFGFRVRPEKCLLFLPSIKYLGFVVGRNGRRPNPDKISAIKRMPVPSDHSSLRSFLGLVNYYGTFACRW
ncbi:hypothetical protein M514_12245 [Trichuris suis]|uniref:Reverse transcriptase domain-containing protein n=1 Tax=Trichuris suis TaxID=68888 RepID=A0A085LPJ1_9BILA|nr:hypothetical protein M513_12245 [Trichuris suis]KFD59901.1 hypothetical protein M514_12245 [Trichuris suis]